MHTAQGEPFCDCGVLCAVIGLPIAGAAPDGSGTAMRISRSTLPLGSNTCTRPLPRSATYRLPALSAVIECGVFSWPGPAPGSPNEPIQSPSLLYLAMRELM